LPKAYQDRTRADAASDAEQRDKEHRETELSDERRDSPAREKQQNEYASTATELLAVPFLQP